MDQYWKNITISDSILSNIENSWTEIKCEIGNYDVKNEGFGKSISLSHFYNHTIEELFGLTVDVARIFWINKGEICPAHIDTISETGKIRSFALNIPLENCDKGTNNWLKFNNETLQQENKRSCIFALGEYEILETIVLDQPKLFRTDIYHNIDNTNNLNNRAVLSYRFLDDLTWEQACNWV